MTRMCCGNDCAKALFGMTEMFQEVWKKNCVITPPLPLSRFYLSLSVAFKMCEEIYICIEPFFLYCTTQLQHHLSVCSSACRLPA